MPVVQANSEKERRTQVAREKNRVDTIYETIRERICLGQYQSGEVFHEAELGQEFEVSRTPIRQVLQRLASEHLAVVRTGVGTIVEDFSKTDVRNYLEMQACMLAAVPQLKIAQADIDYEEAVTTLLVRGSRLSASADAERFWLLLKSIQELCNRMLTDDLLRHIDELLFHRSSPALMHGVRRMPDVAARTLQQNVDRLVKTMDASDYAGFFQAQSENVRRYKALVSAD